MKRYRIVNFGAATMEEHAGGKWAKWEDVEKENAKPECNCEEKAEEFGRFFPKTHTGGFVPTADLSCATWICPAHGYKRL